MNIENYTEETESGARATKNGGWVVSDGDEVAGDILPAPPSADRDVDVLVVALPTGPVDERDPGYAPACAWCNHESSTQEREGDALATAVDRGEAVVVEYDRHGEARRGKVFGLDTRTGEGWKLFVGPTDEDAGVGPRHLVDYDESVKIVEAPFELPYGVIKADYALVDTDEAEVVSFACHSCIQQ